MLIMCSKVVYLVYLPDAQPATVTPLIKWLRGENKMEKHMSRDKDRNISYWLPQWANQTKLRESYFGLLFVKTDLNGEKQRQKLKHLSQYFFFIVLETWYKL